MYSLHSLENIAQLYNLKNSTNNPRSDHNIEQKISAEGKGKWKPYKP